MSIAIAWSANARGHRAPRKRKELFRHQITRTHLLLKGRTLTATFTEAMVPRRGAHGARRNRRSLSPSSEGGDDDAAKAPPSSDANKRATTLRGASRVYGIRWRPRRASSCESSNIDIVSPARRTHARDSRTTASNCCAVLLCRRRCAESSRDGVERNEARACVRLPCNSIASGFYPLRRPLKSAASRLELICRYSN